MRRNPPEERYTLDPRDIDHGIDVDDDDEAGFFHITGHATALAASGAYSTRKRLRDVGLEGLGGTDRDAPDMVSFVTSLDRARWLYAAVKTVANGVHGNLSPSSLAMAVFDWADFPYGWKDAMVDVFGSDDWGDVETNGRTIRFFSQLLRILLWTREEVELFFDNEENERDLFRIEFWRGAVKRRSKDIDASYHGGEGCYRLVQGIEQHIDRSLGQSFGRGGYRDYSYCVPLVGFVAPYEKFARVDPRQVSITQAAVRLGARVDTEPSECELRVRPEDTRLVRVGVESQGPVLA